MDEISPYDILGVNPNDSPLHIKKVYKKLILTLHPDKIKDYIIVKGMKINKKEASVWFDKIQKAYTKIKNTPNFGVCPKYNMEYKDFDNQGHFAISKFYKSTTI